MFFGEGPVHASALTERRMESVEVLFADLVDKRLLREGEELLGRRPGHPRSGHRSPPLSISDIGGSRGLERFTLLLSHDLKPGVLSDHHCSAGLFLTGALGVGVRGVPAGGDVLAPPVLVIPDLVDPVGYRHGLALYQRVAGPYTPVCAPWSPAAPPFAVGVPVPYHQCSRSYHHVLILLVLQR